MVAALIAAVAALYLARGVLIPIALAILITFMLHPVVGLLMQSIINTSFGMGITIGLLLLGVPYALLWGFLAAVLRFIPYVGVWLAALLLIVFALAAFPTWHQPLYVAGLFVLLEALCSLVLEPLQIGRAHV